MSVQARETCPDMESLRPARRNSPPARLREPEAHDFPFVQVDALVQRIARLQHGQDLRRVGLDHADLQGEARVVHLRRERQALVQQPLGAHGQAAQGRGHLRRGAIGADHLDGHAGGLHRVLRDVDAVEVAIVFAAVLDVIDDLQRRAQGVRRGPGGLALAVHVEHEAADRHRRVGAIVNELVPVRVAESSSRPSGTR